MKLIVSFLKILRRTSAPERQGDVTNFEAYLLRYGHIGSIELSESRYAKRLTLFELNNSF